MKRGVVALVLLAGGLLLLGGLLASVEPTDLAPTSLEPRSRSQDGESGTKRLEDLEEFMGAEALTLVDDIELEIPEGSSIAWDGDTLRLIGNVTLTIPEGTSFENLTIVLPEKTVLLPTDGSEPGRRLIQLAPDTRIRLPERYDAQNLLLPEGGEVRDHFIPMHIQREGLEQNNLTLRHVSFLETPHAILEDEWRLRLEQDAHAELAAFAPLLDQMLDENLDTKRTYTNETLSLTAGEDPAKPTQQDSPEAGASMPGAPGSPPPWWAWVIVAAVVAGVALYTGARQVPALFRRRPSPYRVLLRLDDRPDGLPLASAAGQGHTLHVRIVPRDPQSPDRERDAKRDIKPGANRETHEKPAQEETANLQVRLVGHGRLYKGRIDEDGIALPVPALETGDHEVVVHVRHSLLARVHRTRQILRVAPWGEQVARDYQGLTDAVRNRHPDSPAITPRQCRDLLERLDLESDDPAQVVRTFEESNYSPKEVTEGEWIAFALRTMRLHRALRTGPVAQRRHQGRPQRPVRGENRQDPEPRATG